VAKYSIKDHALVLEGKHGCGMAGVVRALFAQTSRAMSQRSNGYGNMVINSPSRPLTPSRLISVSLPPLVAR